jgi:hypothetical protein
MDDCPDHEKGQEAVSYHGPCSCEDARLLKSDDPERDHKPQPCDCRDQAPRSGAGAILFGIGSVLRGVACLTRILICAIPSELRDTWWHSLMK